MRVTASHSSNFNRDGGKRRSIASKRPSRVERREEVYSPAFDLLRARDVLPLVLAAGGAEVMVGAELGAALGMPLPAASAGFALCGAVVTSILAAGQVGVVMALWSLLKILSFLNRRMKRPVYYPQERMRRERLANERRRVRDRFTLNPCPEPKALLAQYAKARGNAREAIRFGSMLCDLEAYCDSSLVRNDDGEIVGRNPGVRGWLRSNCPKLAAHYSNAMRYKGLAEKFRQAIGAGDPVPAATLAEPDAGAAKALVGGRGHRKITVRTNKVNGERRGEVVGREFTLDADEVTAAWLAAQRLLAECDGGAAGKSGAAPEKTGAEKNSGDGGMDVTRCGTTTGKAVGSPDGVADEGANEEANEGTDKGAGRKTGTRCGSVARLVVELDKRLAPERAPSGWRWESVATTRSSVATTRSSVATARSSVATARSSVATTRSSVATTRSSVATARSSVATTRSIV